MEPPPPKSPSKPPLITPSASPPPIQHGAYPRRMSESVPPLKRQRMTSTPRPMTPSSSSASQDPIDVLEQRKASTMRLLDFWDSLAHYTRPLDEDDLVDVLTGEITRDVGVLRNSNQFRFGSLAAPVVGYATSDDGSDTREDLDENEYDVDELDAFRDDSSNAADGDSDAGGSDAGASYGLDMAANIVPPVAPLGPADVDDLREFMEAEQKRRELYGSEDEQDDKGYNFEATRSSDHPGTSGEYDEDEEEEKREVENPSANQGRHSDYVTPLDTTSDDELDNWDINDANAVYPVPKQEVENGDDDDSDIEIIAVYPGPQPSHSRKIDETTRAASSKPRLQHERICKPPRQLYTPPQSNISSGPSATLASDNFTDSSTRPSPTSSASRPSPPHSPVKKRVTQRAKSAQSVISQLDIVVDSERRIQETPARRIDFSKVRDISSPVKATPKRPRVSLSSPSKSAGYTPDLKPFVLLTPRKPSSPQKSTAISQPTNTDTEQESSPSNKKSKSKGKVKQTRKSQTYISEDKVQPSPIKRKPVQPPSSEPSPGYPSDDPVTLPSSSSPSKPSSQPPREADDDEFFFDTRRTPEASNSRDISQNQTFISPTFPSPPIYRKRKRAPSDVSIESPESISRQQGRTTGRRFPSQMPSHHASQLSDSEPKTKRSQSKRSSSRGRQRTPEWESGSDSDESNASIRAQQRRSHPPGHMRPSSYSYPPLHTTYSATHPPPPHGYAPIPDPRAQLIITQAMQQLSALVGAPWIPPHQYHDSQAPQTPSHRRASSRPPVAPSFQTPTHHHHPYPYSYDPNFSHATLPPDSPDESSPEKSSSSRRKSIVRRSRSRGRRVSFHLQEEERVYDAEDGRSSPSDKYLSSKAGFRQERVDWSRLDDRSMPCKGKGRVDIPYHAAPTHEQDRHSDKDSRGRSSRSRAQTPGPSFETSKTSMKKVHGQYTHSFVQRPENQSSRRQRRED